MDVEIDTVNQAHFKSRSTSLPIVTKLLRNKQLPPFREDAIVQFLIILVAVM